MKNTHMPFVNQNRYSIDKLLSVNIEGIWKIHVDDGEYHKINTWLPPDVFECCPTFWESDYGVIKGSFVAGMGVNSGLIEFNIYTLEASSKDELINNPIIYNTHVISSVGFVNKLGLGKVTYSNCYYPEILIDYNNYKLLPREKCFVYRLSYVADDCHTLLISGEVIESRKEFSISYNLLTHEQLNIICDGVAAYKACIFKNTILYAKKYGKHFEDRRIVEASSVVYEPTNLWTVSY